VFEHSETTKTCTKCGGVFPATSEFFHGHKGGLHPRCKVCRREDNRWWQQANLEAVNQYKKRWQQANSTRHNESVRRWTQANAEKNAAKARNYRALVAGLPGKHTDEDVRKQYEAQGGRCFWCDAEIAFDTKHVDHLIPVTTAGSSNGPENLVCSCAYCNQSKNAKDPLVFLEEALCRMEQLEIAL
jgi:hypothetical protein